MIENKFNANNIMKFVKSGIKYTYTNYIKTAVAGLNYLISQGQVESDIAGAQPIFRTKSFSEYRRCKVLMNERGIIQDVVKESRPDDVFYDVGANVGIYSVVVGKHLDDGTVIGFEPEPLNAEAAERHLTSNKIPHDIKQIALSSQNGTLSLKIKENKIGEGRHHLTTQSSKHTIEVETARADDLIEANNIPSPNIIKIDVEGAEKEVLDGLNNVLRGNKCRVVYCELHPKMLKNGSSFEDVIQKLEKFGFVISYIKGKHGDRAHIKATKS